MFWSLLVVCTLYMDSYLQSDISKLLWLVSAIPIKWLLGTLNWSSCKCMISHWSIIYPSVVHLCIQLLVLAVLLDVNCSFQYTIWILFMHRCFYYAHKETKIETRMNCGFFGKFVLNFKTNYAWMHILLMCWTQKKIFWWILLLYGI